MDCGRPASIHHWLSLDRAGPRPRDGVGAFRRQPFEACLEPSDEPRRWAPSARSLSGGSSHELRRREAPPTVLSPDERAYDGPLPSPRNRAVNVPDECSRQPLRAPPRSRDRPLPGPGGLRMASARPRARRGCVRRLQSRRGDLDGRLHDRVGRHRTGRCVLGECGLLRHPPRPPELAHLRASLFGPRRTGERARPDASQPRASGDATAGLDESLAPLVSQERAGDADLGARPGFLGPRLLLLRPGAGRNGPGGAPCDDRTAAGACRGVRLVARGPRTLDGQRDLPERPEPVRQPGSFALRFRTHEPRCGMGALSRAGATARSRRGPFPGPHRPYDRCDRGHRPGHGPLSRRQPKSLRRPRLHTGGVPRALGPRDRSPSAPALLGGDEGRSTAPGLLRLRKRAPTQGRLGLPRRGQRHLRLPGSRLRPCGRARHHGAPADGEGADRKPQPVERGRRRNDGRRLRQRPPGALPHDQRGRGPHAFQHGCGGDRQG